MEKERMKCEKCGKVSSPYKIVPVMVEGHSQHITVMGKQHIGWVRYANEKTMSIIAFCPTCQSAYTGVDLWKNPKSA